MSYRLFTLGSTRLLDEDGSEIELRSAKHVALFVYLNANAWRTFLRSELCELLWTTERSRARHSLSQALYDIRSRVGPVIATDGGETVSLDAPGARMDVEDLESRMASEEFGAACELYRGPFAVELDEVGTATFEDWLEAERRRIQTVGRNAFRRHMEALEESGRWNRLAEVSRTFLKRAPADIDAQRAFIRSLWLGGDRASALEHHASLSDRDPDLAEKLRPLVDRIEGRSPDRVRETPETGEPTLVGRESELRELRRSSRGLDGPTVVHVQGEAGVGKTRLVQELRDVLELDGFELIESRCWEAEATVPYAAVAEALEPWLTPPADGDGPSPGGEFALARAALYPRSEEPGELAEDREALKELRRRVFEEVTVFVRDLAGSGPALWIVEDIQWIDDTSAALFHYLLRRLRESPLLLVFTSRPGLDRDDGLARYLEQPGDSEHLTLEPLEGTAVRELLSEASGGEISAEAAGRIQELSGGNPYFALELLRAFDQSDGIESAETRDVLGPDLVDERLKGVLRERLRGISVEGLKVLEAVAVLGGRASWDVVLSMAGLDVESPSWICRQLCREGLLTCDDGEVEFAHDILRELIYADLGDIRRYSLHRAAAEALARDGRVSRGVLAEHFRLGGDSDRAFHYALAAARDAESRGAHQEAARYAEVALHSMQDDAAAREVELRRLAARAYSSNGELKTAARRLEPLLDVPSGARSEEEIRGLLELAEIQIEEAEAEAARKSLAAAEAGIESSLSGPAAEALTAVGRSLSLQCEIYYGGRDAIEALSRSVRELMSENRPIDGNDWARASLILAAYLVFYRSIADAKELIADVMGGEIPSRMLMRAVALMGNLELRSCHWDRANHLFKKGGRLARQRNDIVFEAKFLNNLGCLQMERGQWREAGETLNDALDFYRPAVKKVKRSFSPLMNLGNSALYQQRSSQARRRYRLVAQAASELGVKKVEAEARACLGLLDLQQGDRRAADRQYRKVRALTDERSMSQEGFKIDWFSAFCAEDEPAAAILRERAGEYRNTDLLSHFKLRWLAEVSDEEREPAEELRRELRDRGLLWYEKFAERWMRATRVNRAVR